MEVSQVWHPDLGYVALDTVTFGTSRCFSRKALNKARGPCEARNLLDLREQCGALWVHLAWMSRTNGGKKLIPKSKALWMGGIVTCSPQSIHFRANF